MLIVEAVVGSRAWGLELPTSDVDIRQVRTGSFADLVSPWVTERKGHSPGVTDDDLVVYDLRHFCQIAAAGNPTMLEIMFAGRTTSYASRFWQEADPVWFIDDDRIVRAHIGFAQSQRELVVKLWKNKVGHAKRIGKAFSSGILTLHAGMDLIQYRGMRRELTDEQRQFHLDLRMGHRLTEGSEELDKAGALMEDLFMELPKIGKTAEREKITEWLMGVYGALAAAETGVAT